MIKNEHFHIIGVLFCLAFCFLISMPDLHAQGISVKRTEWRAPDGHKPKTFLQWKTEWDAGQNTSSGKMIYKTATPQPLLTPSFSFGNDYAYFKGYVRHQNNTISEDLPPITSFIVMLNNDDQNILTDESPRWCLGDLNISGLGWYGIELGNFNNPQIAVGDSFTIVFSSYVEENYEQGRHSDLIWILPLLTGFPTTLQLKSLYIPLPPDSIRLQRTANGIELSWEKEAGLTYTVYRRCEQDTLIRNFPRRQYEKIASGLEIDHYMDTNVRDDETYAYLFFTTDTTTHLMSGHSREISENSYAPEVRAIFVQPQLFSGIETNLKKTTADWEAEGAEVRIYSMQFASHLALRDTLRSIKGLSGALLIGNFPVPWYQHSIKGENGYDYQEYPCDLYYMDLDGNWQDRLRKSTNGSLVQGSDGIYDTHFDEYPRRTEAPEIIIGRIVPTSGMGDPVEVVNFYLEKVHNYRHDLNDVRQQFKALAYADDDWNSWGNDIANDYISMIYPDFTVVWDINQTTAPDYGSRLDDNYSLIHVWVHSWSRGHAFTMENGARSEYFYNTQIIPSNANANFYNLFACGNSLYVDDLNCGAIYCLLSESGINTLGSTHSGGMLNYDFFYPFLAEGLSFGEAFLKTFQKVGQWSYDYGIKGWYYGLVLNGDPFVTPQAPATTALTASDSFVPKQLKALNYPNPFNPETTIEYELPEKAEVTLTVFNLLGQKVRTIIRGAQSAGRYTARWDGCDDKGRKAAAGLYIYQLKAGHEALSKKMILME